MDIFFVHLIDIYDLKSAVAGVLHAHSEKVLFLLFILFNFKASWPNTSKPGLVVTKSQFKAACKPKMAEISPPEGKLNFSGIPTAQFIGKKTKF